MRGGKNHFEGRTALVTGGASGIGLALVRRLVDRGAVVHVVDIDEAAVARTSVELADSVTIHHLDVRDRVAVDSTVGDIVDGHGSIDFLFNNAGISMGGATDELTGAHWDRIVEVNITGVVNGVLAAYPRMVDQRRGHIVNTASAAGLVAPPFVAAYAATKHAVIGLSSALRPEAALHGVRVTALCPGMVETPILDRMPDHDLASESTQPVTARDYLGVVGLPAMPPDVFAAKALEAIRRNQGVVVEPRSARLLWRLHRWSPSLSERVAHRLARQVDRQLVSPRRHG